MAVQLGLLPTAGQPIYQITEAHGVGDIGWSETYFIQVLGGGTTGAGLMGRHGFLIEARREQNEG